MFWVFFLLKHGPYLSLSESLNEGFYGNYANSPVTVHCGSYTVEELSHMCIGHTIIIKNKAFNLSLNRYHNNFTKHADFNA